MSIVIFDLYEYITVLIPVCIAYALLARRAKKQGNPYPAKRLLTMQLFVLYMFLVFRVTGPGTVYDIGKYETLIRPEEINFSLFDAEGRLTYILNVIMLIPFGFLLPLLWPGARSFLHTTLCGLGVSFLIETCQLFNRRSSDVDDLLMNTLGAAIGYACFALLRGRLGRLVQEWVPPLRYEHLLYILVIFLGRFFLCNWRALGVMLS